MPEFIMKFIAEYPVLATQLIMLPMAIVSIYAWVKFYKEMNNE